MYVQMYLKVYEAQLFLSLSNKKKIREKNFFFGNCIAGYSVKCGVII